MGNTGRRCNDIEPTGITLFIPIPLRGSEHFELEPHSVVEPDHLRIEHAAKLGVAVRPHHEPRPGQETPENAMPRTLVPGSHGHSSPINHLSPRRDFDLERCFGWKRQILAREDQSRSRGEISSIPRHNVDRVIIMGVVLKAVGRVFRLCPAQCEHNTIAKTVYRLTIGFGVRLIQAHWRSTGDEHRGERIHRRERGLTIGAFAG